MRKDMQCRGIRPPRLQIIRLIFRKTTGIKNAKLATYRRIGERIGFTHIIKARPIEESGEPRTFEIEFPTSLNQVGIGRVCAVDGRHVSGRSIGEINATRAATRRFFRAISDAVRKTLPLAIHIVLHDIIIPRHIYASDDIRARRSGAGRRPRGIEFVHPTGHSAGNLFAFVGPLYAPFLITNAPEDNRRMVHVSANHLLQYMAFVIIAAKQTRFSNHV